MKVGFPLQVVIEEEFIRSKTENLLPPADFFESGESGQKNQCNQDPAPARRQGGLFAVEEQRAAGDEGDHDKDHHAGPFHDSIFSCEVP